MTCVLVEEDISLYSKINKNKTCTRKVMGKILAQKVLILVESGASSSFLSCNTFYKLAYRYN